MLNSLAIRENFNHASRTYDDHALLQQQVGRALIQHVSSIAASATSVIDLGCGTGATTQLLCERYPSAIHYYAIDIADQGLSRAGSRLAPYGCQVMKGDFSSFAYPPVQFDLVFANMSLQWSPDLPATLAHIRSQMAPSGLLAFSLPVRGSFDSLPPERVLPFYSTPELSTLLHAGGYSVLSQHHQRSTYYFPSMRDALRSIKQVGAQYYGPRAAGLLSLRGAPRPFPLSYEILSMVVS